MKVEPKSAAADRGLKKGDVILEVAGKSVSSPGDVELGARSRAHGQKEQRLDAASLRRRVTLRRGAARKRLDQLENLAAAVMAAAKSSRVTLSCIHRR